MVLVPRQRRHDLYVMTERPEFLDETARNDSRRRDVGVEVRKHREDLHVPTLA